MYEIIEWQGEQGNSLQVQYQQIPLEAVFCATTDLSAIKGWDSTNTEGIDIIDVEFNGKVKASDREAYLIAMISGVIAGMIDYTVVGKTDYKDILSKLAIDPNNLDIEQVKKLLVILAGMYDSNLAQLGKFDSLLDETLGLAEKTLHNAPRYKAMVKDFASDMSIRALVVAIVGRIIGYRIGLDENGDLTFEKINDPDFKRLSLRIKIQLAFTEWLFNQVDTYRTTKKFEGEVQGIFSFKKGIASLKNAIKEIANLRLFREGTIEGTTAYEWFKSKMIEDESDNDEFLDLKKILIKQAIPVAINKALIRTYMFIDKFTRDLKEKNVRSIEGLEFVNPAYMSEYDRKRCDLLEGVAGLIFEAMDLAGAGFSAAKRADKGGNPAEVLYSFATEVNVVNICNLVAICRRNKDEIKDAVKNRISKEKYRTFIKSEEIRREECEKLITNYFKLNNNETKILYSLEYQMVEADIQATKDSETQVKKNKWLQEWMNLSVESTEMSKLFIKDEGKLYAMINTRLGNKKYDGWLHRIALEIALFTPYFPLNKDDAASQKLKYTNKNYVDEIFCDNQKLITKDDIKDLKKTYKKYYDALEHKQDRSIAGAGVAVVVAVGAAVAAYAFAPAIAVFLAGNMFTGLNGAALTSACLALFGGGAIATGGLGMAGGAFVIAGGGAVLGLGVGGGMTKTALLLMTSPSYIQRDQAKLLTTCDYDLANSIITEEDLNKIIDNLETNINSTSIRLTVLKSAAAESKEYKKESADLIKELEKSLKFLQNSKVLLEKMII